MIERGRDVWLVTREWLRFGAENCGDYVGIAFALKGRTPSDHLVQHQAEGEDIAATVSLLPFKLLGRHVPESAYDHPLLREAVRQRGFRRLRSAGGGVS